MIFVFIGGASGSGKTGVSQRLLEKLTEQATTAQVLNMDDYFCERPEEIDPERYRVITNFDTPDMLDFELLADHLNKLNTGNSITKPIFAFKSNRREGAEEMHPSEVIIIEGIFGQYFYKNCLSSELALVSVNVATDDYLDIINRRIQRDVSERGRKGAVVVSQEKKYVGPGFFQFTASSTVGSDVYLVNSNAQDDQKFAVLDVQVAEIIEVLNQKRASCAVLPARPIAPDVKELVAQSHLSAGRLTNRTFHGYFSGVFGSSDKDYTKVFTEEEAQSLTTSAF